MTRAEAARLPSCDRSAVLQNVQTAALSSLAAVKCLPGRAGLPRFARESNVAAAERIPPIRAAGEEVVVNPAGGCVADPGRHSDIRFQLGHCLGAVSVFLIHARLAAYPGHLGLLPRCRRCPAAGRRDCGGRARGTVHPQEE